MERGFSLLEVLLAVALFGVVALLFLSTLTLGQEGSLVAGERARALAIASEGIEAVRNIRDASFSNLPAAGTYGLVASSTAGYWTFLGTSDTTDDYTRTVTITDISSTIKDIVVAVSWDHTLGRSEDVTLTTRLTDWRRAINEQVFRVTEYVVSGGFNGTTYTLNLDQDLESDYFVIVQGADGNGSGGGNTGPDESYVALTSDPFGTGDLNVSASSSALGFTRNGNVNGWQGVITVVECLVDCTQSGFQLHDVARVTHLNAGTSGTDTFDTGWTDINQVLLMGGFNGSGCNTPQTSNNNYKVCHVRLYPSSTSTINWSRDNGGASLSTAYSTVMAVEWGSEWDVQRVNASGNNGGNGADQVGEYNTAVISSVPRSETWVWGTGHTNDNGIGDAGEAVLVTLGDGVATGTTATRVAAGIEYNNNAVNFDVYVMSHADLAVDYRFKPDGDSGSTQYDATTNTVGNSSARMALITNGSNGTGTAYPRPLWAARYADDDTIRATRRRSGQDWPAWIQGIDFSSIEPLPPDTTAPAAITDLALTVTGTSTMTVNWTAPGDDGTTGTAISYDLRYSTAPITLVNWGAATEVTGEPTPSAAGANESMNVADLTPNTLYYFAIRTSDEVPNESGLSNVPSATTDPIILTEAEYLVVDTSAADLTGGNRDVVGITLQNTDTSGSITIEEIIVSWSGVPSNRRLFRIEIDGSLVWLGFNTSPVTANITDVTIPANTTIDLDFLEFTNSVNNITLNLEFVMSDGSTKLISGIQP